MLLRATPGGLIVRDEQAGRWVSLPAAARRVSDRRAGRSQTHDMLAFLAGGERRARRRPAQSEAARRRSRVVRPTRRLRACPSGRARCGRSCSGSRTSSRRARMLVKHFFPRPVARTMAAFERVTGRTFPPLKPKRAFYERPGSTSPTTRRCSPTASTMWWPSHTDALDFELELAFVLARPLADATPEEAAAAIGGWFVLNDWSARDVQADDARHSVFGPVVKSKTFANSMGCDVLTRRCRARLAAGDRARAGGRRAVVRGHDGRRAARPRRDARPRVGRRAPRRGRRVLDRHDARLLRPRAGALDRPGPVGRAGDRRRRDAHERVSADAAPASRRSLVDMRDRGAKPFNILAALGSAAHNGFERGPGSGSCPRALARSSPNGPGVERRVAVLGLARDARRAPRRAVARLQRRRGDRRGAGPLRRLALVAAIRLSPLARRGRRAPTGAAGVLQHGPLAVADRRRRSVSTETRPEHASGPWPACHRAGAARLRAPPLRWAREQARQNPEHWSAALLRPLPVARRSGTPSAR